MGELVMTSFRPMGDSQDEADPRISLIVEPQSQAESQSPSHNSNGKMSPKPCKFVQTKNELRKKLPFGIITNKTKCRIITAVLLILVILCTVAIILALCLKPSTAKGTETTAVEAYHQKNRSTDAWTTVSTLTPRTPSTVNIETTTETIIRNVANYVTFDHPGDSRLFRIEDDGGGVIRTYATKSETGKLLALKHISVLDGSGSDIHIRLGKRNNMASVMLPDSTHISYDMAENMRNIEIRIFLGESTDFESEDPRAFIQSVPINSDISVLTKLLYTLSTENTVLTSAGEGSARSNRSCIPFLPLRVTKCGSQYPYDGAFIKGQVTLGVTDPVLMAALPWPTDPDECFKQSSSSSSMPNYYIPFPVGLRQTKDFCPSYVDFVFSVCSNTDIYDTILFNLSCTNLAQNSAAAQEDNSAIFMSVFKSCTAIFNSIQTICVHLQRQAGITTPSWKIKRESLSSLCSYRQLPVPHMKETRVKLHVSAFCPSLTPFTSPEQTFNIKSNQSNVGNSIHINCQGSPEVTFMSIGHAYAGSNSLNRVMHRFKVCSMCAFETSVRAVLRQDIICCNNTCTDKRVCNKGRVPAIEESTFKRHSSVYCHDFLADRGYTTDSLDRKCLGSCDTKINLDFSMFDVSTQRTFYHQSFECNALNSNSCKREFGR